MWLVDSTKYIDWMRGGSNPTRILRPYVLSCQIATCGVIRAEVIRGAIKTAVRAELSNLFDSLVDVNVSATTWKRVTDTAWALDRQGVVLPLSDLVIAECAREIGAVVVTRDPHFSKIPDLAVSADLPALPPELTSAGFVWDR